MGDPGPVHTQGCQATLHLTEPPMFLFLPAATPILHHPLCQPLPDPPATAQCLDSAPLPSRRPGLTCLSTGCCQREPPATHSLKRVEVLGHAEGSPGVLRVLSQVCSPQLSRQPSGEGRPASTWLSEHQGLRGLA